MTLNNYKIEVRTNRYDGVGTSKVIRTEFFYSVRKPDVVLPVSPGGLIDVAYDDSRLLVRANDVELLNVEKIKRCRCAQYTTPGIERMCLQCGRTYTP